MLDRIYRGIVSGWLFIEMLLCGAAFAVTPLSSSAVPAPSATMSTSASASAPTVDTLSPAPLPQTWTLQACIDYARENNLQVHVAQINLQNTEIQLKTAKASRYPSLSFNSTQGFTNGNKYNDDGIFTTQSQYTGTYQLGAQVTLYNGGKNYNNIKQQKVLQQAGQLLVEKARNDIEIAVTAAFLEVLYAMESVQTDSLVVENSEAQMRRAQARYEAGAIRQSDFVQLSAQYENDRYAYVVAKNNLSNALLSLKQLLELDLETQLQIVSPSVQELDILQALPALGYVYENALSAMPEIAASQLQIEASGYAEKVARSQMIPSLSLNASVGTGYYTSSQFAFLNQMNNNLNENVNVGISIPIYQRRQAKSGIETARLNTQQARLDLQDREKALLKEVEQAYQDALSAQSRYEAASRNMEASDLSYSLVQQEYNVGAKTLVDVLTEKSAFLSSVEELLKAKYQAVLAIRLLDFYARR